MISKSHNYFVSIAYIDFLETKSNYLGGFLLWGLTGTVLGPGLGALGFGLGVGDGFDLLCGLTGTLAAIIFGFNINYDTNLLAIKKLSLWESLKRSNRKGLRN